MSPTLSAPTFTEEDITSAIIEVGVRPGSALAPAATALLERRRAATAVGKWDRAAILSVVRGLSRALRTAARRKSTPRSLVKARRRFLALAGFDASPELEARIREGVAGRWVPEEALDAVEEAAHAAGGGEQ